MQRDVGGIVGFSVLHEAFSKQIEQHLFDMNIQVITVADKTRVGWCIDLPQFPKEYFQLINVVRDSGLSSSLVLPDNALILAYPACSTASFQAHLDSK